MTVFLIPEMDENIIVTLLTNENIETDDKIIIYHPLYKPEGIKILDMSEIYTKMRKSLISNVELVQYLSDNGIETIKHSNLYHNDLNLMKECILQDILDNSDYEEEIVILIPPVYFGDPKIFMALTYIAQFFTERVRMSSLSQE